MEDVIKIIENNKKWEAPRIFNECGVLICGSRLALANLMISLLGKITVIGEKINKDYYWKISLLFQVLLMYIGR